MDRCVDRCAGSRFVDSSSTNLSVRIVSQFPLLHHELVGADDLECRQISGQSANSQMNKTVVYKRQISGRFGNNQE